MPSSMFLQLSFINHSCVVNCHFHFIGDYQFLLATKDIEQGEELTIAYVDPLSPLKMR